jgi:predicted ATPase/class 3 adenylate cyclase/DNA-binding CsgD family transcriptional regulator
MARTTPRVQSTTLIGSEGVAITVGTPAWYTWLDSVTVFAFVSAEGTFTARKERGGRAGWYWKAYRKQAGKVRSAYLGRSADLTFDRLIAAATALAQVWERPDHRPTASCSPPAGKSKRALAKRPAELPTISTDLEAEPDRPLANRAALVAAATLPTGTITFLFTDIEGSTQLWEQHPAEMRRALARHDSILHHVIEGYSGVIFKTVGDAVYAAFARAPDALAAAHATQGALLTEEWGAIGSLRVRMALHPGTAELRDGDYFGLTLSRVAWLLAAGHGSQVLLSRAMQELVRDHLPSFVELHDLGEYRLRDLTRPEQIFQLVAPDLPADFPPLKTLEFHRTNLPAQASPLTGREQEVATVCTLLRQADVRLLTLTGPGGVGKTRLGLQVAAEVLDDFKDGVYFVALAPISDPTLVISTIAQTLGMKEAGDRALGETLQSYLHDKQLLLLLDNFEQVVDAAPFLASLLAAAPHLTILATSRAALHLSSEHEFAVPPLGLPGPRQLLSADTLSQYAAVALFIERAQAVKPDFVVTNDNAPAVAEICSRLDGLPLAILLAAARVKLLSPQSLLARLERRLPLLTGGPRDLPARQQTLRGAIDWSYTLLDPRERTLFRWLGVFVAGCTLKAAAAVVSFALRGSDPDTDDASGRVHEDDLDVLDGLSALVDKSLLRQEEQADGDVRFAMLETIREYAQERLAANQETAIARERHACYFLQRAEEAEPRLTTGEQRTLLEQLDREHDNLRAALTWSQRSPDRSTLGLRLAAALWWFWWVRGYLSEGRSWLERVLSDASEVDRSKAYNQVSHIAPRATALYRAAFLTAVQGDYARAKTLSEESLALSRWMNDIRGVAWALYTLGVGELMQGGQASAATHYEEALACFRALREPRGIAWTLNDIAAVKLIQGDYTNAEAHYAEALTQFRSLDDTRDIASCLSNLGEVAKAKNDYANAAARYGEALALFRGLSDTPGISMTLQGKGYVMLAQGEYVQARALLEESLQLCQKTGNRYGMALALTELAAVAVAQGQLVRAVRLFGSAEAQHDNIGVFLVAAERAAYDRSLADLRARLDAATFMAVWAEGRTLLPGQAIATPDFSEQDVAATVPPTASATAAPAFSVAAPYPAGLTGREVEVLRLLTQGLSYAEIAEKLVISPRTVNRHLTSIYNKLDVTSRHAAARFAIEHHLV